MQSIMLVGAYASMVAYHTLDIAGKALPPAVAELKEGLESRCVVGPDSPRDPDAVDATSGLMQWMVRRC